MLFLWGEAGCLRCFECLFESRNHDIIINSDEKEYTSLETVKEESIYNVFFYFIVNVIAIL